MKKSIKLLINLSLSATIITSGGFAHADDERKSDDKVAERKNDDSNSKRKSDDSRDDLSAGAVFKAHGEINRYSIAMIDDNPFLNLIPAFATENDFGYTYGLRIAHTKIKKDGDFSQNERWNVEAATDLYTKDMTPAGQVIFPNTPQKFNEISTVKVKWDDLFNKVDSEKLYYVIGAGVGQKNNKDDSGFLAVAQQHAWHVAKHNYLTPTTTSIYQNIPGDTKSLYLSTLASVGKVVSFSNKMKDCMCEIDRLKVEGGAEVLSLRQGSRVFVLAAVNKSMMTAHNTNISVDAQVEANLYTGGNRDTKEFIGVQATRPGWSIKTGMTYVQGTQDVNFLQYVDQDPIWTLLVEWNTD